MNRTINANGTTYKVEADFLCAVDGCRKSRASHPYSYIVAYAGIEDGIEVLEHLGVVDESGTRFHCRICSDGSTRIS